MNKNSEKKSAPEPKTRQPYEAPAIISEEVFETLALSCASNGPFQCPLGGISS